MLKCIAILVMALCVVQGQRPPYAGSSNRFPVVLPQYLEERATAAGVANRIDLSGSAQTTAPTTSSTIPPDLPVDARGDVNLVNRIKTWPRDKQPFWFLNWQSIQQHRGDPNVRAEVVQAQPNTRSFFAGR